MSPILRLKGIEVTSALLAATYLQAQEGAVDAQSDDDIQHGGVARRHVLRRRLWPAHAGSRWHRGHGPPRRVVAITRRRTAAPSSNSPFASGLDFTVCVRAPEPHTAAFRASCGFCSNAVLGAAPRT